MRVTCDVTGKSPGTHFRNQRMPNVVPCFYIRLKCCYKCLQEGKERYIWENIYRRSHRAQKVSGSIDFLWNYSSLKGPKKKTSVGRVIWNKLGISSHSAVPASGLGRIGLSTQVLTKGRPLTKGLVPKLEDVMCTKQGIVFDSNIFESITTPIINTIAYKSKVGM